MISCNILVPPPSAPIIVGGKDYYNEASILSLPLIGPEASMKLSHWPYLRPVSFNCEKKHEKTLCVKTENASMQLEQNIHCNKNNIFDEFKTCLRTKLFGPIQIQILSTIQCSFIFSGK